MATGKKTGGRQKGTPNKKTAELKQMLESIPGWKDPLVFMGEIVSDDAADDDMRFQAAKELGNYLYPKRKAIEHTGADGDAIEVALIDRLNAGLGRARDAAKGE